MGLPRIQPLAPTRIRAPFDDPDFVWELKMDGWRCTAYLETADVAGACSAAKFVVKGAGEEYDAPDIESNRKSRTNTNGEYTC
jgi:hypothetical protein